MCKFCDDYCFVKRYCGKGIESDWREHRVYVSLQSVYWNKELRRPQSTQTFKMRDLKYCPSCGIRFGSKEFNKYYKETCFEEETHIVYKGKFKE